MKKSFIALAAAALGGAFAAFGVHKLLNSRKAEEAGSPDQGLLSEPETATTIEAGGASISLPGKWEYTENSSSEDARSYIKGDEVFVISMIKLDKPVEGEYLGDVMALFIKGSGYPDTEYHDYAVGEDGSIEAKIMYIAPEDSKSGLYESYILFGAGSNAIVYGYSGTEEGFAELEKVAFNRVTLEQADEEQPDADQLGEDQVDGK